MKVDFNGLRVQMGTHWDSLITTLNAAQDKDGFITTSARDIQVAAENMRECLGYLFACHEPNDPLCRDLSAQGQRLAHFRNNEK